MTIKLPGKSGASTEPAGPARASVAPTPASPAPSAPPKGEVRIDQLYVSGLDFHAQDDTCDPPLKIPLTGLDVQVRDISSRMPYEDKPMRFTALVNSGLPKRQRARHVGTAGRDVVRSISRGCVPCRRT